MSETCADGTWVPTTLSEIARVVRGRVSPQEDPELPFIGMDGVEAHTMRLLGTVPAGTMKSASVHFQPGDVLYGRLRPYLNKVLAPDFEGLASAEFIPLTMQDGVAHKFIQYRLNAADFVAYASRLDEGDRPRVDYDQIGAFAFDLPPSGEQHRIVEAIESYFTRLDDAVATLERVQRNLKRYRTSVLKAAVEGRLVPTEAELARAEGRDYEPASVLISRVEQPSRPARYGSRARDVILGHAALAVGHPNTELPEGWSWASLVDIARLETGHTPSRKHPEWWYGDVPWIGIKDARVHHGGVIYQTLQHTNQDGLANSAARLLPAGTVCLSRTASIGYVVVMGRPMATSQDFVNWVCTDAIDPHWLRYVLMADREGLRRFGKGTTHTTIYFPEVISIHVAVPPIEEQKRIVAKLDQLISQTDVLVNLVKVNLNRVLRVRSSILKWAFEGKLVDQEPNDEPASVLLERIQAEREATSASRKTSNSGPRKRRSTKA